MRLVPLKLEETNAYVMAHHRHHGPMQGHRFSIGAVKNGELIGMDQNYDRGRATSTSFRIAIRTKNA